MVAASSVLPLRATGCTANPVSVRTKTLGTAPSQTTACAGTSTPLTAAWRWMLRVTICPGTRPAETGMVPVRVVERVLGSSVCPTERTLPLAPFSNVMLSPGRTLPISDAGSCASTHSSSLVSKTMAGSMAPMLAPGATFASTMRPACWATKA